MQRILIVALGLMTLTPSAFGQNAQQVGRGGGGSRYVDAAPINFNDHEGWIQMFDGSTLKG
jgi:hypothetical protein